jgi:hypothetical protein
MSEAVSASAVEPAADVPSSMPTSMQKWSAIVQTPELLDYFRDVFTKAGVTVEGADQAEGSEEFTVVNDGNVFTFHPGIDADAEFVVPLRQENVSNLLEFASDGKIDVHESWRIVQILFTPLTRAALQSPTVRRNWLRVLAGVEAVIHVHLVDPDGGDAVRHTLAYAGEQWLVISGLHGTAGRTYWLSPEQALNFQRQLYKALKNDTLAGWWQFSNWYRQWRITVSRPG